MFVYSKRVVQLLILIVGLMFAATGLASTPEPDKPKKPNILIIVLDDAGYSDLGAYGSEIETPNMDSLATNGLRYSNFHATPTCSPSRAALLTGRDPHRVGMGLVSSTLSDYKNSDL